MSKTIQDYFDNAQFSQASYAVLDKDMALGATAYIDALKDDNNFSQSQATQFAQKYSIVHAQQNTPDGFSATLFKDTAGAYTFAIRGTEIGASTIVDDVVLADLEDIGGKGIAVRQGVDLFNYYQLLTTDTNSQAMQLEYYVGYDEPSAGIEPLSAETISLENGGGSVTVYRYIRAIATATGLGKIPPSAQINVTGHSLGGHLALILARLDPAHINQVYTYNAPGFDTGIIGTDETQWFFSTIKQLQQQQQGTSPVSEGAFPTDKLHNLVIPKDVISDIGMMPNGQLDQFGEAQNPVSAHFISGMVDPLAVYSLLSNLSADLSFEQITPLFKLGSNQAEGDLEGILNALGDFLFQSNLKAISGDRESFYKRYQAIADEIYIDEKALTPVLNPQYQNLRLVDVNSLAAFAKEDNADGFAYRYALVNLNPFAITGNVNLYSQHNAGGELNIDQFTDQYLQDRADFLGFKNSAYNKDESLYFKGITTESIVYHDLESDFKANLADLHNPLLVDRQVKFGSDGADTIEGFSKNDRLYGGNDFDIIKGGGGNDYIEGNGGDDVLEGGEGFDTLIGGAGGDNLHGNASGDYADILDGGQDHDIYHIETSDGDTIIRDSDLQGQIEYDGVTLGTNIKAIVDGGNSYQDDDKNKYTFTTNDLIITLENGQRIVIENYSEADQGKLGLSFGAADAIEPAPITDPVIVGDFEWKDFDLDEPGIQFKLDSLGNEIQDFSKPSDMDDTLT